MATTYQLISSVTVGSGGAANIEFTSIPQTYTDLKIVVSGRTNTVRSSDGSYMTLNFNGSSANRIDKYLYNVDGSVATGGSTGTLIWNNPSDYTGNTFCNNEIYIPNYTSSNSKSISVDSVQENNSTTYLSLITASLWSVSSAITSIRITPEPANFVEHSTAYLYGISNA